MTAIRTTGNNDEALVPYLKALKAEQVTYEKADKKGGNQVMNNFRYVLSDRDTITVTLQITSNSICDVTRNCTIFYGSIFHRWKQ